MSKKTKIILSLLSLCVMAVLCIVADAPSDAVLAFSAIVGVPVTAYSTDKYAPTLNREDISESVTQMMPSRTPLDTILRNIKNSVPAQSQKIGYYQASYKPIEDMLDSSSTGSGATEIAAASSNTASKSNERKNIFVRVKNPDMWRTSDTLLMRNITFDGDKNNNPRVGDSGSFVDDMMFYVIKKSDDVLNLYPIGGMKGCLNGGNDNVYIVPTFTADTKLIRMGQAKSELSITTDPFAIYPSLNHQYCQNFMAQIEESTFQRLTQKEANWGFSNFEAVNILSMKMEMELSMLFGHEGEYISGNDHTYFTRGITRDIENVLEYGTGSGNLTISKDQYTCLIQPVY